MHILTNIAWGILVLVHASPAAVVFLPGLLRNLYAVDVDGNLGVILRHRGALFLAIIVACLFALFEPGTRQVTSIIVAISLISYLLVYASAGMPEGALRTVAVVDLLALAPLALVTLEAWHRQAA
jgi:hypothetical protein